MQTQSIPLHAAAAPVPGTPFLMSPDSIPRMPSVTAAARMPRSRGD